MATNLELKCRVKSLEAMHAAAWSLGIQPIEVLIQTDVYFDVPHGRLKLRRIDGKTAELIQYDRVDAPSARWSRFYRYEVRDPQSLEGMLTRALGLRGVVRKRRTLYLYGPVRIHLDEVEDLGSFLEFEIVETSEEESRAMMERLKTTFSIQSEDVIGGSYIDLLEKSKAPACGLIVNPSASPVFE